MTHFSVTGMDGTVVAASVLSIANDSILPWLSGTVPHVHILCLKINFVVLLPCLLPHCFCTGTTLLNPPRHTSCGHHSVPLEIIEILINILVVPEPHIAFHLFTIHIGELQLSIHFMYYCI